MAPPPAWVSNKVNWVLFSLSCVGASDDNTTELISGSFEDIAAEREEFWGDRLANYRTPYELILEEFTTQYSKGREVTLYEGEHSVQFNKRMKANIWRYKIPAASPTRDIFVLAQSDTGADINVALVDARMKLVGRDNKTNAYPVALVRHNQEYNSTQDLYLFVTGPQAGEKFKVVIYSVPN